MNKFFVKIILFSCVSVFFVQGHPQFSNYQHDFKRFDWQPSLVSRLTPEMVQEMEAFSEKIRVTVPNGKSNNQEELDTFIKDTVNEYQLANPNYFRKIKLDVNSNVGIKPPVDSKIPASSVIDFVPTILKLDEFYKYATPLQAKQIENLSQQLATLWLKQGYTLDSDSPWIGPGYNFRNHRTGFKLALLSNSLHGDTREAFLASVIYVSAGAFFFREIPFTSTDMTLNYYPSLLNAFSLMANSKTKYQILHTFRAGVDKCISKTPKGLITAEGGIVHHGGHHISYASYSFKSMVNLQIRFTKAGVYSKFSKKVVTRMRTAVKSWAWNTLGNEIPLVTQLRPSGFWLKDRKATDKLGSFLVYAVAQLSAYSKGLAGDVSKDTEMASLCIWKARGNLNEIPVVWREYITPKTIENESGSLSFPILGLTTHRRKDWTVMIRGANKSWRGGEVYANAEYVGGYQEEIMSGALFIFSKGNKGRRPNSVDSGYSVEGFDPNLYPNATASQLGNVARASRGYPDYMGSDAPQGGGVSLEGNSVWSWNPAKCRKSAFLFENRITLTTRRIKMNGPVKTALFQIAHLDKDIFEQEPLVINNKSHLKSMSTVLKNNQVHTMLDGNGTGYYIPKENPRLQVFRGEQGYTYVKNAYLKKRFKKEDVPEHRGRKGLKLALPFFNPTLANVSLAYFYHGDSPTTGSCRFTVLVKTDAEKLENYKVAMASTRTAPFIFKEHGDSQYMFDKKSRIHAVTCFSDQLSLNIPVLKSINRVCTVMWKVTEPHLKLVIGATDLTNKAPFEFMLDGSWKMVNSSVRAPTLKNVAGKTKVTSNYVDQIGQEFIFERQ